MRLWLRVALPPLVLLFALVAATGCTQTRVVTHRDSAVSDTGALRPVGELRRLLLLPVVLEHSPEPDDCHYTCDPVALRQKIEDNSRRFLQSARHYQVTNARSQQGPTRWSEQQLREAVHTLSNIRGDATDKQQLVRRLARAHSVDGVIVIRGRVKYVSKWESSAWPVKFLYFLAIPYTMSTVGLRLRAKIFEADQGRLVWASRFRRGGNEQLSAGDEGAGLFEPIEPAGMPAPVTVKAR